MLERELAQLRDDNARLRAANARLAQERDAALARAAALEKQIADLQNQQPTLPKGWEGTPSFAWMNVTSDVLFDSGKADLKAAGRTEIARVASDIKANFPNHLVFVIGHTDAEPIKASAKLWADNLDLSVNRGMAVFKELAKLELEPRHMIAGGQGEYNPKAPNDSRTGRSRENRRVQIAVAPMPAGGPTPGAPGSPAERPISPGSEMEPPAPPK